MTCRNCGTEIADKAIVCYRCGTATTDPVRRPVEIRRNRSPLLALVLIVAAVLIALLLARRYHVLGLGYVDYSMSALYSMTPDDSGSAVYSAAVLVDFRALHA